MDNEQIKKEQKEAFKEVQKGTEKQMFPTDLNANMAKAKSTLKKKVKVFKKPTTYPELLAELKNKTLNIMRRDKSGKFNKYNMGILKHIKAIEHELFVIKRKK